MEHSYCQKQAGHVWDEYVASKLIQIRFEKSYVDECVFFQKWLIFILYIDDDIFMAKNNYLINKAIEDLIFNRL